MVAPLMPKATAVWLVENTSLTFDQIADFCGLHPLEIQAIAETNQQNAANPGLNLRLKLRVYAGLAAPDWAKQLDGPPVTLKDPQTGAVIGTR